MRLIKHIAAAGGSYRFSIERMKANMDISNPFASEIALLYRDKEVALVRRKGNYRGNVRLYDQ